MLNEIPLKSAFTGYFLWFLSTKTAVLNFFNGTSRKCLTPYINVVPEFKTSSTKISPLFSYSSFGIEVVIAALGFNLSIKTSHKVIFMVEIVPKAFAIFSAKIYCCCCKVGFHHTIGGEILPFALQNRFQ